VAALDIKDYELLCQAARALRNLSVNKENREMIIKSAHGLI
jgi:hypothetical protein